MAKRPRMGRNLDALLGGATRERSSATGRQSSKPAPTAKSPSEPDTAPESVPAAEASNDTPETPVTGAVADTAAKPGKASDKLNGSGNADAATDRIKAEVPAASRADSQVDAMEPDVAASTSVVAADSTDDSATTDRLRMIGVDQIRRGSYQPRRLFDPVLLQELADSIKAEGLIQPIIVRRFAGAYELVAGERRWRAAQLAGMSEMPAIVRDMEDKSVAAVSLIENIQRKDLNPLEEAAAFERLCDEFGMTHKAVAESVGRSRASVTNLMRLLELHDEVKLLVDRGELEMGHARAILGAPKDQQFELATQVISKGLTVRAVEKLVREMASQNDKTSQSKSASVSDPDIERLSQRLGETLGAAVRIQHKSSGAGKLEISYASVSELQGILAHIK